jgi:hypothetical protein
MTRTYLRRLCDDGRVGSVTVAGIELVPAAEVHRIPVER